MTARKSLTVHYRRLADVTNAFKRTTLESAIRTAIAHRIDGVAISEVWRSRAWAPADEGGDTMLMNVYHDDGGSFFGDLTQYTNGFMQALLDQQPDVPTLAVEQQPAPSGKEYIHSMMYWLVKSNHIFIIQSRSLSARHLEKYLTWLLKERSSVIDSTGQVILNARFDVDDVGGELEDIKEIIVGGAAPSALSATETTNGKPVDVDSYRSVGTKRPWQDRALDVLRAVMSNEADVQDLLRSIPEEANLQVDVHIGYRTRKRRLSRAPMQQALRNLPEGDIAAVGRHGRVSGNDIRLSFPVRIAVEGSLINPEDARNKLFSAYEYFVENGKIDA